MKSIIIASILAVSSSFGDVTTSFSGATNSGTGSDWSIGQLVLTVTIDGAGNATVTAGKTNAISAIDISSFGGSGTVSAGFGSTFELRGIGRRDNGSGVENSALRGATTEDSIGVSGGNGSKVDIALGNSTEHIRWEVRNLDPDLTFVLNSISITRANFIGPDKPSMVLTDFAGGTGTYTPALAGTNIVTFDDFGTQELTLDGNGAGVNGSFLTGVSGAVDNIGYGINALSFDIVEVTSLVDDDGTSTAGWLTSTGDGVLDTTTETGFMSFVTPDSPDSTFNQSFLKYFDTTSLAVGERISLGATFKVTGLVGTNNNNFRFRFGLFDSTGVTRQTADGYPNNIGTGINGYMGAFARLSGSPTHLYQSDPSNNSFMVQAVGNFEALASENDGGALADNTEYTLGLTIVRTASGNDLTWTMNNKEISVSASDTGGSVAPVYTFDTVAFAVLDAPDMVTDWRFDSISVETTGSVASGTGPDPMITSIAVNGGTATIVMRGKSATTYVCKSSDDLVTTFGAIATTPATVTTDGDGNATFDVDAGVVRRFYLVEEE